MTSIPVKRHPLLRRDVKWVDGVSTLIPGEQPKKRIKEISFYAMMRMDMAKMLLNLRGIGVVFYCVKCREPLDWVWDDEKGVLFVCRKCRFQWVKTKDFDESKKIYLGKENEMIKEGK